MSRIYTSDFDLDESINQICARSILSLPGFHGISSSSQLRFRLFTKLRVVIFLIFMIYTDSTYTYRFHIS